MPALIPNMESYFCKADCDACQYPDEERSICMQARVICDLCQEEGISFQEGVERYAKAFREKFWDVGIQDHHEISHGLRQTGRKVYRIVEQPHFRKGVAFFPANLLESL